MEHLEQPVARHTCGRRPTHSSSADLAGSFLVPDAADLEGWLERRGLSSEGTRPNRDAVEAGLVDVCGRVALWNLQALQLAMEADGIQVERRSVNQEVRRLTEPQWVNLGTVGTYFSVSAKVVGRWLDEMGLRDEEHLGSQEAVDRGLATVGQMDAGGGRTRLVALWNLELTQRALLEAGHELDLDYNQMLKGRGRNGDVTVSSLQEKAETFAKELMTLFRDPSQRYRCKVMVDSQPRRLLAEAEQVLGRPGFLTEGEFRRYIR